MPGGQAMTLLVQDVLVTLLAAGAFALLVQRVAGVVRPRSGPPACGSCASCAPRPGTRADDAVVPVDALRRRDTQAAEAPRRVERTRP
jgi:hypothetical protein